MTRPAIRAELARLAALRAGYERSGEPLPLGFALRERGLLERLDASEARAERSSPGIRRARERGHR